MAIPDRRQNDRRSGSRKFLHGEDLVLIPGIAVLFVIVVLNYTREWRLPPIITSVLLATAIAALVFRFLGGIDPDTTFKMGALKFSGSLAALIGSAYFFNWYLPTQEQKTLAEMFSPHFQQWIALERASGAPVRVTVAGFDKALEVSSTSPFLDLPLLIKTGGLVVPERAQDFTFGVLDELDLAELTHKNEIQLENFVVTKRLPEYSGPHDLDPLPFQLVTKRYGGHYSRYAILDKASIEIHQGSIMGHGVEKVRVGGAFLLVAVVDVVHNAKPPDVNYAKFVLGEIKPTSRIEFPVEDSARSSSEAKGGTSGGRP